jgi:hypothetical protein
MAEPWWKPRARAKRALRADRKLSFKARGVWLMLDTYGPEVRPSIRTLAANCGTTRNTVRAALDELGAAGYLRVDRRVTEAGDDDTNLYHLTCPQAGGGSTTDPPLGQPVTHRGSASDPPVGQPPTQGGSATDPEYQIENQKEPQTEDPALGPSAGVGSHRYLSQEQRIDEVYSRFRDGGMPIQEDEAEAIVAWIGEDLARVARLRAAGTKARLLALYDEAIPP